MKGLAAREFVTGSWASPRRNLHRHVVQTLGTRIVGGELPPGTVLPNEDDLCRSLGVSRTALRESMKVLASKGLVEMRTKTGTRVREYRFWQHLDADVMSWHYETGPTDEFFRQVVQMRRVIEPAAAEFAARNATVADIQAMRRAYDRMCATIGNAEAHCEADLEFHTALFEASHNVLMARMIDLIGPTLLANRDLTLTVVREQERSLPFHWDVVVAVRRCDPAAARVAVLRLLANWQSDVAPDLEPVVVPPLPDSAPTPAPPAATSVTVAAPAKSPWR